MSKVVQDIIRLINSNPEKYKVELQQMIAESSLVNYVELMWHILEPSRNFCRGWHIDCICDHLSAIAYGEIHKLLINVPPGSSKSLLTRVFFPSWIWGPKNMPYKQFLGFSYAQSLSERDNVKFRKLIQSPEYKSIWGNRFSFIVSIFN